MNPLTTRIPIGRLLGVPVSLHWTLPGVVIAAFLSAAYDRGLGAGLGNALFILLLFACILAHEYGHILAARACGLQTTECVLSVLGGVAFVKDMEKLTPARELFVVAMGPLVNVAIFAVLLWYAVMAGLAADSTVAALAFLNLLLAAFNMIPGYPMDGGRILRATLQLITGNRLTATRAAFIVSIISMLAFASWGVYSRRYVDVFLAAFIVFLAWGEWRSESSAVKSGRRRISDRSIRHLEEKLEASRGAAKTREFHYRSR